MTLPTKDEKVKPMISDADLVREFEGMYDERDGDVRQYAVKVVTTRVPHKCPGYFLEALHDVPAKSRMVMESAIVDGKWSRCYTCEFCVTEWARKNRQA